MNLESLQSELERIERKLKRKSKVKTLDDVKIKAKRRIYVAQLTLDAVRKETARELNQAILSYERRIEAALQDIETFRKHISLLETRRDNRAAVISQAEGNLAKWQQFYGEKVEIAQKQQNTDNAIARLKAMQVMQDKLLTGLQTSGISLADLRTIAGIETEGE
jgi:predicted RNase H-like nuclease (RuvC/YqgF family)